MPRTTTCVSLVAAALACISLAGCGGSTSTSSEATFCDSMGRAVALLEPGSGSPAPEATRVRYRELTFLLDVAEGDAPPSIAADVTRFATAVDEYAAALAAVDYDLDALYLTPDGVHLADDTSHALTVAVIEHITGTCGLALGS